MTVGSLLPPPIRTIASNLARRRRKNHGFEPHIGKLFPPPFPSFFLPRFFGFFPPSLLPAAFLCQRLPSLFLPLTALFSPISPPATRPARLIWAFRSFLSAHQSSVYPQIGNTGFGKRRKGLARVLSPHLAPFAPSHLPCCLGLSCSPLGFSP